MNNSNGHIPAFHPGPDCESFADLLPLLGAGTLDERDALRLRAHTATCAYCRTQRATYDRIDVALRRYYGAPAAPLFSPEDIMSVTDEGQRPELAPKAPIPLSEHHPRRTRRVVSIISGIAAVLVIIVVITGIFASRGSLPKSTSPGHPGVASATHPSTPVAQETPYVPSANDILGAVQMLSPSEGWAVGDAYKGTNNGGTFSCLALHYSNGQWKRMATPTDASMGLQDADLQSISMASPDEGWAVGWGDNSSSALSAEMSLHDGPAAAYVPASGPGGPLPAGLILHYSAGKWTKVSIIPDAELWSVQMLSPTDGWAAGGGGWGTEAGATTSILLHYDGSNWTPAQVPGVDGITSLDMLSATDGWATGTNAVLHYDGKQWTQFQSLTGVSGLSMDSATDGWAFGFVNFPYNHTSSYNAVWHYNGSQWVRGSLPSTVNYDAEIVGLFMDSASDGWAVGFGNGNKGENRYALYLHYTNGQWTQVQGPGTNNLDGVFMLSANEGWAVGVDGALMHYQNGIWTQYHS